jgi:hypothetical protein
MNLFRILLATPTEPYVISMLSISYAFTACVTSLFVATFAFLIGRHGTLLLGYIAAIAVSVTQSSTYSVVQPILGTAYWLRHWLHFKRCANLPGRDGR